MPDPDIATVEESSSDAEGEADRSEDDDIAQTSKWPAWPGRRAIAGTAVVLLPITVGTAVVLQWRMVGLAFVLLAVGLVIIFGGVWLRLSGEGTKRVMVVSEVTTDAGVALMTGAVLGLVLFAVQDGVEENRFAREQRLEEDRVEREVRRDNVRFVREVATQPDAPSKPFVALDLQGAELAGLDLTGANLYRSDLTGANLIRVNLTGADLYGVSLAGADLPLADLYGANLAEADLSGANLAEADLTRAILEGADLSEASLSEAEVSGANLGGADLSEAILDDVVHDSRTTWPDGFTPPPSASMSN